ncbi:endomucin isoform X3 [Pseudophryne corroboree]|uniref:endomucin isoform X3 n=1 Tax=Pseudophryne corroboree TaxID=495146 RepID=UPI003081DE7D
MKPIRAAALVLSVINLLTVSSNTSGVNSTSSEATTQGILISNISATNVTPTYNASTKTDITDSQTKNGFETSTRLNQSTDHYHPTATSSKLLTSAILTRQRTTNRTSSNTTITPRENYATIPDIGTTEKTKDNITDNITAGPQIVDKVYDQEDTSKNDINGGKPTSLKAKKEIVIGVGCVLSVIVLVVLVFLYKMCQKKAPVSENTELKGSAQNKDSVKLLSVKSATPYTDAKRMSSNQMEFVEC